MLGFRVETVDLIIVAFVAVLALVGWRQGFVLGVLSLIGFAGGALLGTRLAPLVLPDGSSSPYAPLLALIGALVGGLLLATGLEGIGGRLRRGLRHLPGLAAVDGLLGAVLCGAIGLGLAWIAGAVVLQNPSSETLRGDVQRSAILSRLNDALPPSGPLLNALARIDPFPALDGPTAGVGAPRAAIARDPEVRLAARSVVRVTGTACGLGLEGSGWVAGPGLVVTNAHVVAGQVDTVVQLEGDGARLHARVLAFDRTNDVAVLGVDQLQGARSLQLVRDPDRGIEAAILGFPGNGPYDVRAARLAATRSVLSQDAYGKGPLRRTITTFRGRVRPGNSGGPVVDADGRVVATVFATARGGGPRTGYGVPNARVRAALAQAADGEEVASGPCAD